MSFVEEGGGSVGQEPSVPRSRPCGNIQDGRPGPECLTDSIFSHQSSTAAWDLSSLALGHGHHNLPQVTHDPDQPS